MGFSSLFTTPHSFMELYPNSSESLLEGRSQLHSYVPKGVSLFLSSEYYLDEQFTYNLENNGLIPLPGKRLLIEFSQASLPLDLEAQILNILEMGYVPIIAHPERYAAFQDRVDFLSYLKSLGALLQLNALSLSAYYGGGARIMAERLIDDKLYDFIGTDLHHAGQIDELRKVPGTAYYGKLIDSGILKNQSFIDDGKPPLKEF
jgi:tyrosine-protein phosphatase YwqE